MIIQNEIIIDEQLLIESFSDSSVLIKQVETDTLYDIVIDIPNKYTYVETDIPVSTLLDSSID